MGDGVRYVFNWDFYGTYPARPAKLMEAVKKLPAPAQLKILKYLGCAAYIGLEPMFSNGTPHKVPVNGIDVLVEPDRRDESVPICGLPGSPGRGNRREARACSRGTPSTP